MTTATEAPTDSKTDQLADLRAAEARLEKARQEWTKLDEKARAYSQEVRQAQAELNHLARIEPQQFDDSGQPRPKTAAGKLKRKLDDAKTSNLRAMVTGAEDRIAECEAEVRTLTRQHAVELARDVFRGGEDDLAGLDEPAAQMLAVIDKAKRREARLIEIARRTGGRLDGQDVFWDPGLDLLREALEQVANLKPPRSVSLTPLVGEDPILRRSHDGGWIKHWDGQDLGEQPEPQEPRR